VKSFQEQIMATEQKNNADGSVDIPLSKAIEIDGTQVTSLRMREPTVSDWLAVQGTGTDAEQELALIANLCMVDPSALRKLSLRDGFRAKAALAGFID
jgi:hypothetical protein